MLGITERRLPTVFRLGAQHPLCGVQDHRPASGDGSTVGFSEYSGEVDGKKNVESTKVP